jgi:hypothetical protein
MVSGPGHLWIKTYDPGRRFKSRLLPGFMIIIFVDFRHLSSWHDPIPAETSSILRQKRQFQRQIIGRKKLRKIITLVPDQDVRLFAPKLTIRRLSQWIDSKNTDVRTRVTRWLKWKIAKKISPTYFFVKIYALLFLWNSSSKVGPTYIIFKQNCRK